MRLGRRMAGRELGLASALVLCSIGFFVGEMRQASNDGPLVLFTTLALYAAWRRSMTRTKSFSTDRQAMSPSRRWSAGRRLDLLFHCALALGFLTKGPVILLLVAVTVVPYLVFWPAVGWGLRRLADGWGLLIFAVAGPELAGRRLARRSRALRGSGRSRCRRRPVSRTSWSIAGIRLWSAQWPGMVLPWTLIALVAVILPFYLLAMRAEPGLGPTAGAARSRRSSFLWFAWWWARGQPGGVLLLGGRQAQLLRPVPARHGLADRLGLGAAGADRPRPRRRGAWRARGILQAQWVLLFVAAVVAPLVVRQLAPGGIWPWSLAIAVGAGGRGRR